MTTPHEEGPCCSGARCTSQARSWLGSGEHCILLRPHLTPPVIYITNSAFPSPDCAPYSDSRITVSNIEALGPFWCLVTAAGVARGAWHVFAVCVLCFNTTFQT